MVREPLGEVVTSSTSVQRSEPGALPGHKRSSSCACADQTAEPNANARIQTFTVTEAPSPFPGYQRLDTDSEITRPTALALDGS
jgi:hypothetical protein